MRWRSAKAPSTDARWARLRQGALVNDGALVVCLAVLSTKAPDAFSPSAGAARLGIIESHPCLEGECAGDGGSQGLARRVLCVLRVGRLWSRGLRWSHRPPRGAPHVGNEPRSHEQRGCAHPLGAWTPVDGGHGAPLNLIQALLRFPLSPARHE
jgi:hypothetical protein